MITTKDLIKYYTAQDLKAVSSRQLDVATAFVAVCRSNFRTNTKVSLTVKKAKHLKTTLKTLGSAFPEAWYTDCGERTVSINIPRELLHDASNTII